MHLYSYIVMSQCRIITKEVDITGGCYIWLFLTYRDHVSILYTVILKRNEFHVMINHALMINNASEFFML